MPYVGVHFIGPLDKDQKQNIARDITDSLGKHAGKPADAVLIEFIEGTKEDWAKGGVLYANK